MISVFDKPDTPAQAVLAMVCVFLQGAAIGVFLDRRTKQQVSWPIVLLGWAAAAFVCWMRRYFV